MTERPILFSAPMVLALLAGRKTRTRRVIKPVQPRADGLWPAGRDPRPDCPYGNPGDRLWVRETWRTAKSLDHLSPSQIAAKAKEAGWESPWAPIKYEADGVVVNWDASWGSEGKTRVSIHMPRWASRLTLEVTEVRVQRLQEISEEDAKAEGLFQGVDGAENIMWTHGDGPGARTAREAFRLLWDSINGERPGCAWASNPWVWAISFRKTP